MSCNAAQVFQRPLHVMMLYRWLKMGIGAKEQNALTQNVVSEKMKVFGAMHGGEAGDVERSCPTDIIDRSRGF